jgi:photosynthetic reaction center cytochrome c subunit
MMSRSRSWLVVLSISSALLGLAGCERPPISAVQHGYRGTGMDQIYNPRTVAGQAELNTLPAALPAVPSDGPRAGEVYKNVQVLGGLSVAEFTRHMTAITSWVAPQEGCAYCHNLANLADDSKYTKVVARRMIQMTQHVNADWKTHVAGTGVTCYTCHRGNPVPSKVWFAPEAKRGAPGLLGYSAGQNTPSSAAGLASLPVDPFTAFLSKSPEEIRVIGPTALPTGNLHSTKQAEWTYGLMIHMSSSLGVNCTYCHNSRSFQTWDSSTPQRSTAWYGIRMTRDLNTAYLEPLTATFPAHRLGPTGDVAKVNCGTCHQGAYKPLYGQSQLGGHPELASVTATVTAPPAAAPAADAAPAAPAVADSAIVYFGVNSSALPGDAASELAGVIAALKSNPESTVSISGFHSAAGNLTTNQELAKQRAFSVRDAIVAAGIPADRVKLDKPQSAEANLSGEDPKARRVEVALK